MWPLVFITTIILYVLIIVTLPISAVYATILLFTLISFWSRLPGVGMPHPFFILYNLDLIDLFCMIIAINLGGAPAAVFALFTNLWSRACGSYLDWLPILKDAIFQAILCLFIPFVYSMTGSLLVVAWFFTIGRSVLFLTMGMLIPHKNVVQQIIAEVQFLTTLLIINTIYVSLFGSFFDNLLKKGVAFSWPLFLFATAVIIIAYFLMYGHSQREGRRKVVKKVVKKLIPKQKEAQVTHENTGDSSDFTREKLF